MTILQEIVPPLDLEQLQQMLNLEEKEGQARLLTCRQDSPTENYRMIPLKL